MGIISTKTLSVKEFLQHTNLEIPYFQRPYKWTTKNVIQLIDDINRFKGDKPYLIGTIVIYKENNDRSEGPYQIVDGQQRTITFLLILKAILNKKGTISEELITTVKDIHSACFQPTFKNETSKNNIQRNYLAIIRRLEILTNDFVRFFIENCKVTFFVIDDISEAFQFFDSQNARGKDLEPHDLLKAFHLRELPENFSENEKTALVTTWEDLDTDQLAKLFANFLYRVRSWSKGDSSRYFSKKDINLFKGINLDKIEDYPYTIIFKYVDEHVKKNNRITKTKDFPFQLDQTIINGKYFFEMISHYKKLSDQIKSKLTTTGKLADEIIQVIDTYEGRGRTGDKYVRMLFDCALIFYYDKFGPEDISKAIEKIFIWAYSIRLTYQNLQLISVDNYVLRELNFFKIIKEATYSQEIENIDLPLVQDGFESAKTEEIRNIFKKMNYYVDTNQQ